MAAMFCYLFYESSVIAGALWHQADILRILHSGNYFVVPYFQLHAWCMADVLFILLIIVFCWFTQGSKLLYTMHALHP